MQNWKEIWNKKSVNESDITLESLIKADGFDSGFGSFTLDSWLNFVREVAKNIDIKKSETIFEVGCGSGAFLYPFYQKGYVVGGLDYSDSLIQTATKAMPDMKFICKEADKLDIVDRYDIVVSNSVLHYFKNHNYTKDVIEKMIQKSKRVVAILDINDNAKKEYALKLRRGSMSKEEYEKRYKGLEQLYYDKEWFQQIAKEYNLDIEIEDQNVENYENSSYRFNVYMFK